MRRVVAGWRRFPALLKQSARALMLPEDACLILSFSASLLSTKILPLYRIWLAIGYKE